MLNAQFSRKLWIRSRIYVAVVLFIAASLAMFSITKSWETYIFGNGADPIQSVWFINWWKYSIEHAINPFISHYLWYPNGFYLVWHTSIPSVDIIGLPILAIFGPIATYNVIMLLAPALSSWGAFLLSTYITDNWLASMLAGYTFGFSSYQIGQETSHLNLALTFLVPLAVLLCLKRIHGVISKRKLLFLLSTIIVVEFGISLEILATAFFFGFVSLLIFYSFGVSRNNIIKTALEVVEASIISSLVLSPFLIYLFYGIHNVPKNINSTTVYSADPLNFVVPTTITRFGRTIFSSVSARFSGNPAEQGAYIGIPMLLLAFLYFREEIYTKKARSILLTVIILSVSSLGPILHIDGYNTHLIFPWYITKYIPFIKSALPTRFTMYIALCGSIVMALFLQKSKGIGSKLFGYSLSVLCILAIMPNLKTFKWQKWPQEKIFSKINMEKNFGKSVGFMVLPFKPAGDKLAWQIDAKMGFKQAAGYIGFAPKPEDNWDILKQLRHDSVNRASFRGGFSGFCVMHNIRYILVGPTTSRTIIKYIDELHWKERYRYGFGIIKVPAYSKLKYSYIRGDYWPTNAKLNWMGRRVYINTHGQSALLTVTGIGRPIKRDVVVEIVEGTHAKNYEIGPRTTIKIKMKANTENAVIAQNTFVPESLEHNGDTRHLSVRIGLKPRESK